MAGSQEPLRDIVHLGYFELLTKKRDDSLRHLRDLLGMDVVHEEGRSVWLRGWGDYAAASLKLTSADTSVIDPH